MIEARTENEFSSKPSPPVGDETDRWAVERIVDVERPARRRGRQLLVKVQWVGDEYPDWWVPVARLTPDLRPAARQLERRKYAEADATSGLVPSRRAERRLAAVQRQLRERWEQQVSARTRNGMLRAAGQGETVPDMDVG